MSAPLVSIITVTFNSSSTIADTIASVRTQKFSDMEHIVVDGASTDSTVEIVRGAALTSPFPLRWISEPDKGIYDAMNKGIAMAQGEIVGILNSDDLYFGPDVIPSIVELMQVEGTDGCYGDLVFVDRVNTNLVKRTWVSGRGSFRWGWVAPHPTLYLRRAAYQKIGGYRSDFKISSDYDLMLRVFRPGSELKVSYLPAFLVRMRDGGVSTRNLQSNRIGFAECQTSLRTQGLRAASLTNVLRVIRKVKQLLPQRPERTSPQGRRAHES